MSAVFGVLLLVFFATLFRALGLGCVCIGMSGSRILLPSYFTRGLPRVLCNADEQASNLRSVQMCFNGEEDATSNFQGHYTSQKHMHNCNTVPGRVLLLYIYQDTAPMPRRAAPEQPHVSAKVRVHYIAQRQRVVKPCMPYLQKCPASHLHLRYARAKPC